MLLAIDIGNSNIVLGIFNKDKLIDQFRLETDKQASTDRYKELIQNKINGQQITDIVVGSVVPELDDVVNKAVSEAFSCQPLIVSTKLDTGIPNLATDFQGLGADRLANIVAAHDKHPGNSIVIDLGTATKFEAVSEKGEYLGGAIGPGIGTSYKALISSASKLEKTKLENPEKVVAGCSTNEHLNSGYIFGFASLVEGMIERIKKELKWHNPTVICTGGFTELITPHVKNITVTNQHLTLDGLKILWEKNK